MLGFLHWLVGEKQSVHLVLENDVHSANPSNDREHTQTIGHHVGDSDAAIFQVTAGILFCAGAVALPYMVGASISIKLTKQCTYICRETGRAHQTAHLGTT